MKGWESSVRPRSGGAFSGCESPLFVEGVQDLRRQEPDARIARRNVHIVSIDDMRWITQETHLLMIYFPNPDR